MRKLTGGRIMSKTLAAWMVLLGWTSIAAADVIVHAPFVHVRVPTHGPNPGVQVFAPFTHVWVGQPYAYPTSPNVDVRAPFTRVQAGQPPLAYPQPTYGQPVDPKDLLPPPRTTGKTVAVSHYDFARTFRPAPGNYEVEMIHPITNRPVIVRFMLPPANRAPKVRVGPNLLEYNFDDIDLEVEIHFLLDGRVFVKYDD